MYHFVIYRNAFPGLNGGGQRRQHSFNSPKKRPKKNGNYIMITPKETRTHDFCVLSEHSMSLSPTLNQLCSLREAGLGRRKVVFQDKNANHQKLCEVLEEYFPKLKTQHGAFELLRAEKGGMSQKLFVVPLSAKGYTVQQLKEVVSSNTVIYVRPMQSSLTMEKVPVHTDEGITTQCQRCCDTVPLNTLREHMRNCQPSHSSASSTAAIENDNTEIHIDDFFSDGVYLPVLPEVVASTSTISSAKWDEELSAVFPHVAVDSISTAVNESTSIQEAANQIIDLTNQGDAAVKREPKCEMPKNLNGMLTKFAADNSMKQTDELAVDREALWLDMLKFYKRKISSPSDIGKSLEVSFKGEDGLDGGTIRVELFGLAIEEATQRLFEGDMINLVPIKDSTMLFLFRMFGMMLVHVIIQGGPLDMFPTLAPSIITMLLDEDKEAATSLLSKHHIPLTSATEHLHSLIDGLDGCKTEDEISRLFEENDSFWQIINHSHWPAETVITLQNKNLLIQELIYDEVIASRLQEIGELKAGLSTLGFLQYIRQHPDVCQSLFCAENRRIANAMFGPKSSKATLDHALPRISANGKP
eukprot:Seg806.15 transcript_id=Seg806.15/GoldUCD/mRNA.D3Y31 product="hypothetical protein" protein_id=Seg806.15/GoldUCD/D3Y31